MVEEILVEADLEAGRMLIERLAGKRLRIKAAQWVPWGTYHKFAIITPLVDSVGPLELYRRIQRYLDPAGRLKVYDLLLVSPKDDLARKLAS